LTILIVNSTDALFVSLAN